MRQGQDQKSDLLTEKLGRLDHLRRLQTKADKIARKKRGDNVFKTLNFQPNPGPQSFFLGLPDTDLDVLYGGAVGGGKSMALLAYALRACVRYDGLQVYWFRCTYPELDTSVIKLLTLKFAFARDLGARWVASKYELVFPNGSVLRLAHAKNVQEAISLRSAEFQLLILDERTTIPPDVVELLYTRIRSGVPGVPVLGIRSATNPGGPGHSAVLEDYIRATDYGQNEIEEDSYGRRRIFIQSKLTDTPQLMNDGAYLKSLMGLPEIQRRALLDGDWEATPGQMFGELTRERHVVEPITLPPSWRRYAGVDWGWRAPWAVIWGAVDEDGRIWLYREIYQTLVRETQQARSVLEAEANEEVISRYADDAMWVSRGEMKTIAQVYEEEGCDLTKAGKGAGSRPIGFARIHDYLAEAPACYFHRSLGWETCPMLHMFSTCENMFKELKNIEYDTRNEGSEDSNPKMPDHLIDALRYLLVNIGTEARWHFMSSENALDSLLSESQVKRAAPTPLAVIGGHPVMPEGGDPWSNHLY
jgi:hypothetical protein